MDPEGSSQTFRAKPFLGVGMGCIRCGRGFCRECPKCRKGKCHDNDAPGGNVVETEAENEALPLSSPKKRKSAKENLRDPKSTGRKRAAQLYPINSDDPCEWRGLRNCGGGRRPIIGCLDGTQKHRHHGPVKDTTRNEQGNVHRICTDCNLYGSRVLNTNLDWINVEDICVGDTLITFDENIGGSRAPLIKYAKVVAVKHHQEPSYKFVMEDGTELNSSHAHKWVASSPSRHHLKWYKTEKLKTGYNLRKWLSPWESDLSYDAGWLAGYLDGEGALSGYQLSVAQKLGDGVYEKGKRLLESYGLGNLHYNRRLAKGNTQDVDVLRYTTQADILRVIGAVKPVRLLEKIPDYLFGQRVSAKKVPIVEIEDLGMQDVVSIQTTSGTLVVDGYLSHNCHVHWHELNDLIYDEKDYNLLPHDPQPAETEEIVKNKLEWVSGEIGRRYELASTKNMEKFRLAQVDTNGSTSGLALGD